MHFKKPTPKWYLILYSILLTLLGLFSICLLFKGKLSTPFMSWYSFLFVVFNIASVLVFLGGKYEVRSWAVPLCFMVFGFVGTSLVNRFMYYMSNEGIYFLHFVKTVFLWLFILLALIIYLHPHVKKVQEIKKKEKKPKKKKKAKKKGAEIEPPKV